jgi:hypothetical protein
VSTIPNSFQLQIGTRLKSLTPAATKTRKHERDGHENSKARNTKGKPFMLFVISCFRGELIQLAEQRAVQKSSWAPNLKSRPTSVFVGRSHAPPVVPL